MTASLSMPTKWLSITLVSCVTLIGCGGDDGRRSTSNSSDLNGLWRLNIASDQNGLTADSNSSFLMEESGENLQMTDCAGRSLIPLQKEGDQIVGLPGGPFTIASNDKLTASSNFGEAVAKKMDLDLFFDMGSLTLAGDGVAPLATTDVCVVSTDAKVLGAATQEAYSGHTQYLGNTLTFELTVMGAISKKTYEVEREANLGQAQIRFVSESFKGSLNRTEVALRNGSLTVTEDSAAWLKGDFSGEMPNGVVMSGGFELEKP